MAQTTLTDASSIAWNLANFFNTKLTATSAVGDIRSLPDALLSLANQGDNYQMVFVQDAIGGRKIAFGNSYKVIGDFNYAPNGITIVTFVYDPLKTVVVLTSQIEIPYWIRIDNLDFSADLHKADGNLDTSDIEDGDIIRSAIFLATNTHVPYATYDSSGGPNTDIDNYIVPLLFS